MEETKAVNRRQETGSDAESSAMSRRGMARHALIWYVVRALNDNGTAMMIGRAVRICYSSTSDWFVVIFAFLKSP
jgi:hypothetical protein